MRKVFGVICLVLAGLGWFNLVSNLSSTPKTDTTSQAYNKGRKVGRVTAPVFVTLLGFRLLFSEGSGATTRRKPEQRAPLQRSIRPAMTRTSAPLAPVAPVEAPAAPLGPVPVKVQCACGQKYAFEVVPVEGRVPNEVKCPICGADGTQQANECIAKANAARASTLKLAAAAPPVVSHGVPPAAAAPQVIVAPANRFPVGKLAIAFGIGVAVCLCAVVGFMVLQSLLRVRSGPRAPMAQAPGGWTPERPVSQGGPRPPGQPWSPPGGEQKTGHFSVSDKVTVFWGGQWQPATITSCRGPVVFVHFDPPTRFPDIVIGTNMVRSRN